MTEHLIVTHEALDIAAFTQLVTDAPYGAVASFLGTVRSPNKGETVLYIDYEGYDSMIKTQMKVLARELRERYELGNVLLAHRLGRMKAGEASIAIVISSKHRKEALSACHDAIYRAKELLPVWKHEVTESGSVWVEGSSVASKPL